MSKDTIDRWIEFEIDSAEQAVLEQALKDVSDEDIDWYDLRNDEGKFVYAGEMNALRSAIDDVWDENCDSAARILLRRIGNIVAEQREQKQ